MGEPTSTNELSPLDQIRLVETDVTRKIVAAREASDRSIADARVQATLIKKQAHEAGEHIGQIRCKEIISEAEEEAQAIISHAHNQADDLRRKGYTRMELAVQEAISTLLGLKGGGKIK
jgi:vacuolar-type H+-ATPase subunit H